ncbi:hypothetical protein LOZ65_005113 [Ophidiomyces ophidiicola]|nr:hypothetical protein LOZ65_005113 [Ophidiomyces ophidiicola]
MEVSGSAPIVSKAYVVDAKGTPFALKDVVLDSLQSDEVLVELKYTGICHTDLVVQQGGIPIGGYPAILGHEGVGIIRLVGFGVKDKSLREGDTVILAFRSCRKCSSCLEGRCGACPHMMKYNFLRPRLSEDSRPIYSLPNGTPVHGQFFGQSSLSKMAIVAENCIVKCNANPDSLRYLPPLGCGYLTGAGTVFNVLCPKPTTMFAILGVGAVGMAALLAAKSMGVSNIIAVDIVDSKLDLAVSLGATHTINTTKVSDLNMVIKNLFPSGLDQILDTTGVLSVLQDSFRALGHEGILALVGVPHPGDMIQVDAMDLLISCKRIVGVVEGFADPEELIPRLVKLYSEGKFAIDRICTVYPAESLDRALGDLRSGKVIKPILCWESL